MTERPQRGFMHLLKRYLRTGLSLGSLLAAGGVAWKTASDGGAKDERFRQMQRDIDDLRLQQRAQQEWLFKTLFRSPAPPAGPGGMP